MRAVAVDECRLCRLVPIFKLAEEKGYPLPPGEQLVCAPTAMDISAGRDGTIKRKQVSKKPLRFSFCDGIPHQKSVRPFAEKILAANQSGDSSPSSPTMRIADFCRKRRHLPKIEEHRRRRPLSKATRDVWRLHLKRPDR